MSGGISLKFDNDDNAAINTETGEQCFGGVVCQLCIHESGKRVLDNGRQIDVEYWICQHINENVIELEKCPLKYWVKMAVPIGHQNIRSKI